MKFSPFLRDIVITTATSIITMISSVFVTRYLALGLGPIEFGAYTLAMRVVSTILPASILSMDVALARYGGLYSQQMGKQALHFLGSLWIVSLSTAIISITLAMFRTPLSRAIFSDPAYAPLVNAIAFTLVGYAVYALVYADYRGRQQMGKANLLQIAIIAIGPLILTNLFAAKANASWIVFLLASLYFVALVPLVRRCRAALKEFEGMNSLLKTSFELLRYGVPRTPGTFAFAGLLSLGPILAPHFAGLEQAGYLTVGQSLIRIVDNMAVAFALVALPRFAYYIANNKENFIRESAAHLIAFLFHIGFFLTLHSWLWADLIVRLWLGEQYLMAIPLIRIISLAIIPYMGFVMLRTVIDAVEVRAVNTWNLFVSLGVEGIASIVLGSLMGVNGLAVGTLAGFSTLGGLTVLYLRRRFRLTFEGVLLWGRILCANIGFLLVAWAAKNWWVSLEHGLIAALGRLVLVEGVLASSYLLLLRIWKVGWIEQLKTRLKLSEK